MQLAIVDRYAIKSSIRIIESEVGPLNFQIAQTYLTGIIYLQVIFFDFHLGSWFLNDFAITNPQRQMLEIYVLWYRNRQLVICRAMIKAS